jgi:predicted MFS family arabinose efflux permease
MAGGAAGFVLLGLSGHPAVIAAGSLLAFASGWGWPGLFHLSLTRLRPDAAATATGIAMTGIFVGSALGPLCFGALAEHVSYSAAWWFGATTLFTGSLFIRAGRRMLIAERARRDHDA